MAACDYVGIVSGLKNKDKFKKSGFHQVRSEFVNAPIIEELPITLECELYSYQNEVMVGKIINVSSDERFIGPDGLPDLDKFTPITFDPIHHDYLELGEAVGEAFSIGKEKM
jgi:flavin reductase (DIM6/NTAB) family NADH-FMN oxidoreductase RutF